MLTPGEFVVRASQARKHRKTLEDINSGNADTGNIFLPVFNDNPLASKRAANREAYEERQQARKEAYYKRTHHGHSPNEHSLAPVHHVANRLTDQQLLNKDMGILPSGNQWVQRRNDQRELEASLGILPSGNQWVKDHATAKKAKGMYVNGQRFDSFAAYKASGIHPNIEAIPTVAPKSYGVKTIDGTKFPAIQGTNPHPGITWDGSHYHAQPDKFWENRVHSTEDLGNELALRRGKAAPYQNERLKWARACRRPRFRAGGGHQLGLRRG